jgi:hypothetical protein
MLILAPIVRDCLKTVLEGPYAVKAGASALVWWRELRRLARKGNLGARGATNWHDGQITKSLSIPLRKNIPLNVSGKSAP